MLIDSMLFDLDGTLWDSVEEVIHTWNSIIAAHPGLRAPISREEQESVMGLQMDEIARRLFPGQPADRQMALMAACTEAENAYLYDHGARLYPGVPETLEALRKQVPLYIVSNCQCGYIEAFLHAHGLELLFRGHICYGDTLRSKGENMAALVRQEGLAHPVYVGDTQGDLDAADLAGVPFVFAAYGFGQINRETPAVHSFQELLGLL